MKISFVVLTHNEEKNLARCLESIKNIADEILVIDDNSTDKTIDIARNFGARILMNNNCRDFSAARNLGLENAKNEWVFFIDADEQLEGKANAIKAMCSYRIHRTDVMWGQELKHGENGQWNQIRLVRKGTGKWKGKVHEVFVPDDEVCDLNNVFLKHYPHASVAEFLSEINLYSEIRAQELRKACVKSNVWQIAFYPLGKFIVDYFFLLGFLDKTAGFVAAAMMSFYTFLVRAKLYLLCNNKNCAS